MMDDGWGEIIGSWLEEDLRLRRKLRRTAKAIHEQLKPLGFLALSNSLCIHFSMEKAALRRERITKLSIVLIIRSEKHRSILEQWKLCMKIT